MLRADADIFTVGFVGTLKPWHGLAVLVEAFGQLRDRHSGARMLIVGAGPQQDTLMADLKARGLLEFTEFTGALDPLDVPRTLATMDVAVAPYLDQPGFYFSPLKVFEYMAAGLPVVASRVGQLEQLIEDGVNGLLVTPGDSRLLAAALEMLHFQPQLRYRLGHAARATVLRNHTWNQVTSRILALAGIAATRTHGAVRS
jgi:glycosyltransferase involved in cell wall biosynthesis